MAPPERDVMGARMHVNTDPPKGEDDPPLQRPAVRAKQPSRPVVELETEAETEEHAPAKAPYTRKDSPPGGIKLEGMGMRITMPHVALVAVLTTIGGWFGNKAVSKGESAELADVLREVRAGNKAVQDLKGDVADVREDQRKARSNDTKILNYAEDTFTPIVASLRRLGVKVDYDGKADPARDVEFHPAPLGGNAPPIQPKATLPERPSL
jgi:hypothetical protein